MKSVLYTLIFLFLSINVSAQTVVDVIVGSDDHNTLEAAVLAAGLAETLSGDGPFTVFAPTDAAFAALPAGTVDALLEDPSGDLRDILMYHVVSGTVLSSDLSDGQMAATLNGQSVNVSINADGVFINDAQVIVADIQTDNGVVHVIDVVLIPDLMSAIEEIKDFAEISLFPNPSADFINIKVSNINEPVKEVIINNINGKLVKRIDGQLKNQIDISELSPGTYVVSIVLDKMSYSKKFTIYR